MHHSYSKSYHFSVESIVDYLHLFGRSVNLASVWEINSEKIYCLTDLF